MKLFPNYTPVKRYYNENGIVTSNVAYYVGILISFTCSLYFNHGKKALEFQTISVGYLKIFFISKQWSFAKKSFLMANFSLLLKESFLLCSSYVLKKAFQTDLRASIKQTSILSARKHTLSLGCEANSTYWSSFMNLQNCDL